MSSFEEISRQPNKIYKLMLTSLNKPLITTVSSSMTSFVLTVSDP